MAETNRQLAQETFEQAKQALARKRFSEARRLLNEAEAQGLTKIWATNLRKAIRAQEEQQNKLGRNSTWVGLLIGGLAYFILLFTPLNPRQPAWIILAMLLVPGIVGVAVGRLMGFDSAGGARFRRAAFACGFIMFGYAFIRMIWERTRFAMGADAVQVFLVWLTAAAIYALLAGVVAGLVARFVWGMGGKKAHGTAS